jgi:hypothetical protein
VKALEGNLEYALTRVRAHFGSRPSEVDWRALEASRDLSHYIDTARAGALAMWVSSFDANHDVHTMERSLRTDWRRYVDRVASWHPQACQNWLRWLGWLPMLSLLAQLCRPEPVPHWMLADPVCGPIAPGSPGERGTAIRATALAPLAAAIEHGVPIAALWREHWQRLEPLTDPETRRLMSVLLQDVDRHLATMATTPAIGTMLPITTTQGQGEALRQALAERLVRVFRQGAETVVATVCYLALVGLDLERLRGGLVTRCLLPWQASGLH